MQFVQRCRLVMAESSFACRQGVGQRLSQLCETDAPWGINTGDRATDSTLRNL
jgi:hypothetical protein